MTEFSKEYIALLQRLLANSPYKQIKIQSILFKHVVDEIERLQAENDLLQTNRKCLNRDLAKAQSLVKKLEQELKNKCANCGLAIPHGVWGDEDNDYDNLPKLPQDEE